MKKIVIMSVILLTVLWHPAFTEEPTLFGGFQYFGPALYYFPQQELNQALDSFGYTGFQDFSAGIMYGGGGVINGFYFGGWGCFDIIPTDSINSDAGMRLRGGIGGRGGFEVGYLISFSSVFSLIPNLDFIWGGSSYTFNRTVDFEDYIEDPDDFNPTFGTFYMSFGGGVNVLIFPMPMKWFGFIVKLDVFYSPSMELDGQHFTNAPGLNPLSVMASLGFVFGGINKIKMSELDIDEVPEK